MHPQVSKLLSDHAANIAQLCRDYGVLRLALFGSALTTAWDPASSDLDFVAEFGPPPLGVDLFAQFFVFQTKLQETLGRPIDLVEKAAVRKPRFLELLQSQSEDVYAA
jgi:predicted nucleotidyltransferase